MSDHADQTLPGLTFLFAQRQTDIGQHDQVVRFAALPEAAAPDLPAAGASRALFGIEPADPLAITGTALILSAVGTLAGLLPVRRAMKVDPATALRCE
jgi:hypothetical protein